jgi:hypothetical protein
MSFCSTVFRARGLEDILPDVRKFAGKHRKPYEAYINECVRHLKISRADAKQRLATMIARCDCTQYIEIHRLFKYRATYNEFIAVLQSRNIELIRIFIDYGYPKYYPNEEAKKLLLMLISQLEHSDLIVQLWERAELLPVATN